MAGVQRESGSRARLCQRHRGAVIPASAKLGLGLLLLTLVVISWLPRSEAAHAPSVARAKNAYATLLYMGTPRDYEFYVAARVLLRSLKRLQVDADLVVIASSTVPLNWKKNFYDDGVRVVTVEDIQNPYRDQPKFAKRFMFTLNKIYAWTLTDYERVVMLDVDNVFLQGTDELFKCGDFCAAFINPCIFHTGLFVVKVMPRISGDLQFEVDITFDNAANPGSQFKLPVPDTFSMYFMQPSNETFGVMHEDIVAGRENRDGADQGFLTGHFNDLLNRPMFYPPKDDTKLSGHYRLPLGYQMDASYFYLKLKWSVPCGPNSVITFPSVPLLKPWYWWSYPVLPLGLLWHEQRRKTVGYGSEIPLLAAEGIFFVVTMIVAMLIRQRLSYAEKSPTSKTCFGRPSIIQPILPKVAAYIALTLSFVIPFIIIPTTVHPLMGWGLWLLSSLSCLVVIINIFQLPILPVITPWLGFIGVLLVMANPYYTNGVIRALAVGGYAFVASPFLWWTLTQVSATIDHIFLREPLMAWTALRTEPQTEMMKLC